MKGTNYTGRDILKSVGAASSVDKPSARSGAARQFPEGFFWGTATSAFQIEDPLNYR